MKISVSCAACGSTFSVNEKYAGQRFACRECRAPLEVPSLASLAPAAERSEDDKTSDLLRIKCTHCGKPAKAAPSLVGRKVRCKRCGEAYRVEPGGASQRAAPNSQAAPLRAAFDVDALIDPAESPVLGAAYGVDPLLSALDDVAAAPLVPPQPLAPKRSAPLRTPPARRRRRAGPEVDMGATLEGVLGILGVLYGLASIGLIILVYQYGGIVRAIGSAWGLLTLAHAVVYLFALVRIGANGSAGFAVLCLVLPCIGEIMALVASSNHAERWRVERILPAWTFLFVSYVMFYFAIGGAAIYYGASEAQRMASQNLAQYATSATPRRETTVQTLKPIPPTTPIIPPADSPPEVPTERAPSIPEQIEAAPVPAAPRVTGRKNRPEPTTTDEEITRAIEDLNAKSPFERRDAATTLKRMPVDESRREEVARALGRMLDDRDPFFQEDVSAALIEWATADNIPQLVRLLLAKGHHSETNRNCMQALARLKDQRGADAVAQMLFTRDFQAAIAALKEMGPLAEDAVLPLLDNDDAALRREVCGILEDIGTSKSLKDLRRHLSGDRGPGVREAARRAVTAIEERDGPLKRN